MSAKGLAKSTNTNSTYTTDSGLTVNVRGYEGAPLKGQFNIVEPPPKITIAYDIAGNAIEVDLQDILDKKLRPTPDFRPATQEEIDTVEIEEELKKEDKKTTRSGRIYEA
mgnify:CR=1 FL=1|tara:strand:+ start:730 stop:1059 length:330 start_codon:yes stop_codon:yes gene_type:complete